MIHSDLENYNRSMYIKNCTEEDLDAWTKTVEEIELSAAELNNKINEVQTILDSELLRQAELTANLSMSGIADRAMAIIECEGKINILGNLLSGLQKERPRLDVALEEHYKDIIELKRFLSLEADSDVVERWIDDVFLPAQEAFKELKIELDEKLKGNHALKVGENNLLKYSGKFQYLSKIKSRSYEIKSLI